MIGWARYSTSIDKVLAGPSCPGAVDVDQQFSRVRLDAGTGTFCGRTKYRYFDSSTKCRRFVFPRSAVNEPPFWLWLAGRPIDHPELDGSAVLGRGIRAIDIGVAARPGGDFTVDFFRRWYHE